MAGPTTYRLTVRSSDAGSLFAYEVRLWAGTKVVAITWTDTVWGAKVWARRQARKDRALKRTYEFEVKA